MVWIRQHYTGKSLPWFHRFEIKSAISKMCFILLALFFKVWTQRVFLLWVWMNFSSYFPDWKGKYGSEINNELCFFITVVRAAFHENVHSEYWYSKDTLMTLKWCGQNKFNFSYTKQPEMLWIPCMEKLLLYCIQEMTQSIFLPLFRIL